MTDLIKLSRSRLELFLECPRCFWLLMNKNIKRPPSFPYTINMAIDQLLKDEFDKHRSQALAHEIIKKNKIDAIPFDHPKIDEWRNARVGIQFHHQKTGFLVYGAIDDIWTRPNGELIVVDYKASGAKEHKIYESYKRQMEVYQWLFKKNEFKVSKTGYFVFAMVNKEKGFKDAKLSFDMHVDPCDGDDSWIEDSILKAQKCIKGQIPKADSECKYCKWYFDQKSEEK